MVSVRREGSSKFGNNNKWGTFPSISAGWTISNESFMKDVTWLDNLKLRAGFGITGVIPGDPYKSLYKYGYDAYGDIMSGRGLDKDIGNYAELQSEFEMGKDERDKHRFGLGCIEWSFKWFYRCL